MLRKTIIVCPAIIWCLYLYRGIYIQIYDTPYKMGVVNLNIDTLVQVQAPDEGWEDDDSLTEHLLGVILDQQYNLKKGLELFGDRAEAATTKVVLLN